MTRLSIFDSPLFLGFDHFERTFDQLKKSANEGYPPYNIEQTGPNSLRITLAVAGFTMDDLDVSIDQNQLVIRGRTAEDDEERVFLHRGIAARQFQKSFVLADGIEILGASLDSGLLHVEMEQIVPESKVKNIKITNGGTGKKSLIDNTIDVESNRPKKS
jgi:HSP20 family molecular chaperone IbpA|tara:strand:+ start:636 stop:1115 length:480 start_codon:yes stop_codon:yes gene_type:complete